MSMTLVNGGNTVTFSPMIDGYQDQEERRRVQHKAMDGTLFIYDFYDHHRWSITVNAIVKSDYDQLSTWWESTTLLTFTPDTNTPGTTYQVKITNENNPLQMMFGTGWKNKYEGTLNLREI